jgi:hypothetical protein
VNGRRRATMLLAASLGLNLALGAILVYQSVQSGQQEYNRFQRGGDRRSGPPWGGDRRSSVPDSIRQMTRLSEEQVRSIRQLRNAMETEIEPIRDEIRRLQGSLRNELELSDPNPARVDSFMTEIWSRQRVLQKRSIDLILEERDVLTPQQFRSFLRSMLPGVMGQSNRDDRRRDSDRSGSSRREESQRPSGTVSPPPPGAPPIPPPGQPILDLA